MVNFTNYIPLPVSINNENLSVNSSVAKAETKPIIIRIISILYWLIMLSIIPGAIGGGSMIEISNNSMKNSIPGYLDYHSIKLLPWIPVVILLQSLLFVIFFYTALKINSGSSKAWKAGFITLIGYIILGILAALLFVFSFSPTYD